MKKMNLKEETLNTEEGKEYPMILIPSKKLPPFPSWSLINTMNIGAISKLKLNASTHNVFWHILSLLEYSNEVFINQADFARELDMTPATICHALKNLEESGLIRKTGKKTGVMNTYIVNPKLVYKGKNSNFSNVNDSFLGIN